MKPLITSVVAVLIACSAATQLPLAQAQSSSATSSAPPCTAQSAGNPCYGTGSNVTLDKSAANPVNLSNGNKFQEERDYFGAAPHSGLEFFRYYNSTQLTPSFIGQGWRHSYERQLYLQGRRPQILLDDSTRISFDAFEGDVAQSPNNEFGSLTRITSASIMERLNAAGNIPTEDKKPLSEYFSNQFLASLRGDLWLWQYPSGAIDIFNGRGRLIVSQMPAAEAVFIERETRAGPTQDAILFVQNRSHQGMSFEYQTWGQHARISHIKTPSGRIEFEYDVPVDKEAPRLLSALLPDGARINYQYQANATGFDEQLSPYLLRRATHFQQEQSKPYRDISWRYNSHHQAVEVHFHQHEELSHPLSMRFNYIKVPQFNGDTGLTEVRQFIPQPDIDQRSADSALQPAAESTTAGTLSRFHSTMLGSQYLLTKAEGAPCFKCPAPGTTIQYNEAGYITAVNHIKLKRHATDNHIESIEVAHRGWPGLKIFYDKDAKPYAWSSLYTGKTFYEIDPDTLYPKYKNYANGTHFLMRKTQHYQRNGIAINYGRLLGSIHFDTRRNFINKPLASNFSLEGEGDHKSLSIKKFTQQIQHRNIRKWSSRTSSMLVDLFNVHQQDRIVEHSLPEQGTLYYHYDKAHELSAIYWQAVDAEPQQAPKLLYQRLGTHQRQYGNQLISQARPNPSFSNNSVRLELLKAGESSPYWREIRYYRDNGLLAAEHHLSDALKINKYTQFEFNQLGQLMRSDTQQETSQGLESKTNFYAWQAGGMAYARQQLHTRKEGEQQSQQQALFIKNIKRDRAGFIQQMDDLRLIYDESNLLKEVHKGQNILASYEYDGLNQRIRKTTPQGETQYYYLNQQLVAEAFLPAAKADKKIYNSWGDKPYLSRRYIYDGHLPVALIDYSDPNKTQIYYIHSDGSGQPFLVTDEHQQTVWLADNEAFGKSQPIIEKIEFNLRLPGQYYDAETGLHQNIYRNYDPELGHYLEPDPLGPVATNDAYGYANQNPRQWIDPLGLLMFVFDGTTNTPSSQTNAYKLGQLYDDGPVHYIEGLGTEEANLKVYQFMHAFLDDMAKTHTANYHPSVRSFKARQLLEWKVPHRIPGTTKDMLLGSMAPYVLNMQWMRLVDAIARIAQKGPLIDNFINIDLSGFSRGAALASIFANKIAEYTKDSYFNYTAKWRPSGRQQVQACLNLRFVGLFDTVHQFGALGFSNSNYNFTVSPAWQLYAHAVAMNEHRMIFPLTSFHNDNADNVMEQGFLGVHSDIGGALYESDLTAFGNDKPGTYGDLSNIPLNWVYDMATTETDIKLKDLDALTQWRLDTIQNPLTHMSDTFEYSLSQRRWRIVDREVISDTGGFLGHQRSQPHIGGRVRLEHNQALEFLFDPLHEYAMIFPDNARIIAKVKARQYLSFLEGAIGWKSSLKVIEP